MNPPRVSKDPDKIKYVSLVRKRWVYRPYIPAKQRNNLSTDKGGFLTPILLGKESDPWHTILAAHAAAVEQLDLSTEPSKFTLRWIADEYEQSEANNQLSDGSRTKNKTLRRILDHKITINGKAGKLGEVRSTQLSMPLVNTIRDKRLKQFQSNGRSGYSHCNREITYLSTITRWASNRFEQITGNPFLIPKLKENVNTRYVHDDEYQAQMIVAAEVADYLPVALELIYLLASRGCEALTVETSHIFIDDDGDKAIYVDRTKGSESNAIKINPRLQSAIDAAIKLRAKRTVVGKYLIVGTDTAQLKKSTLDDAMQRLKKVMKARNMQSHHSYKGKLRETEYKPMFWTMHDLKRKGVSDAKDKRIAGHKSESMRDRYSTKLTSYDAPD